MKGDSLEGAKASRSKDRILSLKSSFKI